MAHNTPSLCTQILNNKFEIYNSVPKFASDWRWYKSLYGHKRQFNENFLSEYYETSHCMIDYRIRGSKRLKEKNIELEKLCFDFATITKNNENYGKENYIDQVEPLLSQIINIAQRHCLMISEYYNNSLSVNLSKKHFKYYFK